MLPHLKTSHSKMTFKKQSLIPNRCLCWIANAVIDPTQYGRSRSQFQMLQLRYIKVSLRHFWNCWEQSAYYFYEKCSAFRKALVFSNCLPTPQKHTHVATFLFQYDEMQWLGYDFKSMQAFPWLFRHSNYSQLNSLKMVIIHNTSQ